MQLTKELLLQEREQLERIRQQLEAQTQDALMRLARAEGGIKAISAMLEMLNMPEPEVKDDLQSRENAGVDREEA